jgi:hypothetical protein
MRSAILWTTGIVLDLLTLLYFCALQPFWWMMVQHSTYEGHHPRWYLWKEAVIPGFLLPHYFLHRIVDDLLPRRTFYAAKPLGAAQKTSSESFLVFWS